MQKLNQLQRHLEQFPLDLAIAFGSQVKGDAFKFSDLDIAIRFKSSISNKKKLELMDRITVEVMEYTGNEKIDLLDLDEASPEIGYKALKEGKLILGNKEEATELQAKFLLKKLDFASVKEEWRKAMTERIEKGEYGKR